jgi:hypothetical protein
MSVETVTIAASSVPVAVSQSVMSGLNICSTRDRLLSAFALVPQSAPEAVDSGALG